jgi:predicted DNA-binding helix-hairpin-helix protein
MIVGASPESDGQILRLTQALYRQMHLKRVYYSSYLPVVQSPLLPTQAAGLLREHRLYQADWLLRFYGFDVDEIVDENQNLCAEYDPKCAWALRNMQLFPIEVNTAPLEMLLRVPGIGARGAYRIMQARKNCLLTYENLEKMRILLKRAKHFITCNGKFYGDNSFAHVQNLLQLESAQEETEQLSLFSTPAVAQSALTGEL